MVKKDAEIKFRIDKLTMETAYAKARELDIPLSQILRQLLREWLREGEETQKEDKAETD
jgi:antitoxin component of RelBE/YafQ-DinJ toxin-antitoxin module